MSDTTGGGGKSEKPKRERKGGGGAGGARAKRASSGGVAGGGGEGGARNYAYSSADEAQKVLKRAISGFAKAGAPLDVRMDGASLSFRLPARDQQSDELRKVVRRLKPKSERGGGKKKDKGAAETGGAGGEGAES